MKRLFLTLLLISAFTPLLEAQLFNNVRSLRGQFGHLDANDNSYTVFSFAGNTNVGGTSISSTGVEDVIVAAYTPSHQLGWFSRFSGQSSINEVFLEADNNDDLFTAFAFSSALTLPDGTVLNPSGGNDALLAKIDHTTGNLLWHLQLSGSGDDAISCAAIDGQNNIYISGYFHNSITLGNQTLTSVGGRDLFLCKLSPTGQVIWAERMGSDGGGIDNVRAIAVNNSGRIALSAIVAEGNVDVGSLNFSYNGFVHALLASFDTTGTALWLQHDAFIGEFDGIAIADNNQVYATGNFDGNQNFLNQSFSANGLDDMITLAFDPTGSLIWHKTVGNSGWDRGFLALADGSGGVFIAGTFSLTAVFDANNTLTSVGQRDAFLARYDAQGNLLWVQSMGNNISNFTRSLGMTNNQVWLTGWGGSGTFGHINHTGIGGYFLASMLMDACEITGKVYRDWDNSSSLTTGDAAFPYQILEVQPGGYYLTSALSGDYRAFTGTGSHTVSIPNIPNYYTLSTAASQSANFTLLGQRDTANHFGLLPMPNVQDLRITLTPVSPPRAGYLTLYRLAYSNLGTVDMPSGLVELQLDTAVMSYTSSAPSHTGSTATTWSWSFSNLLAGETRYINVYISIPGTSAPGTPLAFAADVTPIANDTTPADNSLTFVDSVINSFDPNDKQVFPNRDILLSEVQSQMPLEYLVRFQNTGNAPAINVVIRDTLSNLLDIPSFEMLSASHNYTYSIDGKVVTWTFANIMLPDSISDEPNSHGMVRYRIQPKSNLMLGEQIMNRAAIYFDFNEPIITNTTVTEVVLNSNTISVENRAVQVQFFPNPMRERATLRLQGLANGRYQVRIVDVMGRVLLQQAFTGNELSIQNQNWPAGVHFFQLLSEEGQQLARGQFIVQ